jgi:hypothetical protein
LDVTSEDDIPNDLEFNSDGTKMLVVGAGNKNVYEYNLSTGFDISTASYSGTSFDVDPESYDHTGIAFNSDGTEMFIVTGGDDTVFQYNLGTGFEISTASYSGSAFDVSGAASTPVDVTFNDDGTKMFINGSFEESIFVYDLSTGFDLSTVSFSGTTLDVSSEDTNPTGLSFNTDGSKMFLLGNNNEDIYEYEIGGGDAKAQLSVDIPEVSAEDGGTEVTSDLASLDFGKALTATGDGNGNVTAGLDAGFESATFSGDGSKTQFQIPHGLSSKPTSWIVQSATDDGKGISYVTADSTSLTVNYDSAPPSGTDNVELNWIAIQ